MPDMSALHVHLYSDRLLLKQKTSSRHKNESEPDETFVFVNGNRAVDILMCEKMHDLLYDETCKTDMDNRSYFIARQWTIAMYKLDQM